MPDLCITQDFDRNRRNFRAAARGLGVMTHDINIPAAGDKRFYPTTVATMGNIDAKQAILVTSGFHGVELPAGSCIQQQLMRTFMASPKAFSKTFMVVAHAMNARGAVYGLRTDFGIKGETNIDPMRNLIDDFSRATRKSPPTFARAVHVGDIEGWRKALMWSCIAMGKLTTPAFIPQIVEGQHIDPYLPFYSGKVPTISRLMAEKITQDHFYARRGNLDAVCHLDLHTGRGPYGELFAYTNTEEDSAFYQLAARLVPPERIELFNRNFSGLTQISHDILRPERLGVMAHHLVLEIGTTRSWIPDQDVLSATINRTILQTRYHDNHPRAADIIQATRDAFCPRDDAWEMKVAGHAQRFCAGFVKALEQGLPRGVCNELYPG